MTASRAASQSGDCRRPARISADVAAAELVSELERFVLSHPKGWVRREGGITAMNTGAPVAVFNGVIVERDDADFDVAARLLDEIAETGVPYSVSVRCEEQTRFIELARCHALTAKVAFPLMILDSLSPVLDLPPPAHLEIREIAPEESGAHAAILAPSFGIPVEVASDLMRLEVLQRAGVRCYVGEYEGVDVATAIGVTHGGVVALFNVATIEGERRRGFGRALTIRAIADGFADGATWSYLQSSPMGLPIYQDLGYVIVETWITFLAGAQ